MGFAGSPVLELTILGMGSVFFCLALLYAFFAGTGRISVRWSRRLSGKSSAPAAEPAAEAETEDEVPEEVVAVIGLALAQARRHLSGGAEEGRVSRSGAGWREQGRLVQHQRSRHWGTR